MKQIIKQAFLFAAIFSFHTAAQAQQEMDTVIVETPGGDLETRIVTSTEEIMYPDDVDTSMPQDGFYSLNIHEGAKPFPYPEVKKNNVMFFKRVWRDINLNDSMNRIFLTPGSSLMEVLMEGLQTGRISAYDPTSNKENPTGDKFTKRLTAGQAMGRLSGDSVLVPIFNDNGEQVDSRMMVNDFSPESVSRFRIKEDIFFDNKRSRIETRIIGLAPLVKVTSSGESFGDIPAFWFYFPEARKVLVQKEVVDPNRDVHSLSYDDIFIRHSFTSTIVKEANPMNERPIATDGTYPTEADQGKDSERIEKEIRTYKKKTWKH